MIKLVNIRAVPRILLFGEGGGGWGKLRTPLTGVSRIQIGFLVGRFCFHPHTYRQKVVSKTFKENKHTDAFVFNIHDFLWHKHLVYLEIAAEGSATQ